MLGKACKSVDNAVHAHTVEVPPVMANVEPVTLGSSSGIYA
jgi:hypothetical protein